MNNRFESFVNSIMTLNRCLQKLKDVEMKQFGLKANHTMCLYYLGQHSEGLTSTQLTELCREDKAAISRSLNQLTAKNLVYSDQSQNKRSYRTLHYLTDSGKVLAKKMDERIEEVLLNGSNGLSDEQRVVFLEAMALILANLTQYLNNYEEND